MPFRFNIFILAIYSNIHVLTRVLLGCIMKLSELIKILKMNGIVFLSHGRNHDKYVNKENGTVIIVPRHSKEIPTGTAEKIFKDAVIKRR